MQMLVGQPDPEASALTRHPPTRLEGRTLDMSEDALTRIVCLARVFVAFQLVQVVDEAYQDHIVAKRRRLSGVQERPMESDPEFHYLLDVIVVAAGPGVMLLPRRWLLTHLRFESVVHTQYALP
jgi:hypothetical protein